MAWQAAASTSRALAPFLATSAAALTTSPSPAELNLESITLTGMVAPSIFLARVAELKVPLILEET